MIFDDISLAFGLSEPRRILVIEDYISFAQDLSRYLVALGHTVVTFTGVESIEGDKLIGMSPLLESRETAVNLAEIDVCFLDHYFAGRAYNGTTLTPLLVGQGVKVCGMSSVDNANASMRSKGAILAFRKDLLERAVR